MVTGSFLRVTGSHWELSAVTGSYWENTKCLLGVAASQWGVTGSYWEPFGGPPFAPPPRGAAANRSLAAPPPSITPPTKSAFGGRGQPRPSPLPPPPRGHPNKRSEARLCLIDSRRAWPARRGRGLIRGGSEEGAGPSPEGARPRPGRGGAGSAGEAAAEPSGAGAGPGAAGAGPGAPGPGPSGAGRDPPGPPGASEAAMPSKKKKYNARFPPARIKKIMQTDEEIGKVAAAVPVIISRALELFLESLLRKACHVTQSRNAKTMTTSHLKQCIELEQQFDFLKDLVATVPDMQGDGDDPHGDGERGPRRGRRPGSGRKNGGPGAKGTPKQSGTDSEQEEDSEDSDSDGDEETPQPPPAPPPLTFARICPQSGGRAPPPSRALLGAGPGTSLGGWGVTGSTGTPPPCPTGVTSWVGS
uniref:Dr1-associated corepressor n=1 Tax=Corvus moneduloides TaxID=1196302 RepID=A0A8U7ND41_CORMO